MEEKTTSTVGSRKRIYRVGISFVVSGIALIVLLPAIIANTPLRHSLVSQAMADRELQASVGSASFGWFSPVSLQQLDIVRNDHTLKIDVDRLEVEAPLLNLLFSLPTIGTIQIDRPRASIVLRDTFFNEQQHQPVGEHSAGSGSNRPGATFTAIVRDGTIVVRAVDTSEPIIDLSDLSVTVHLRQTSEGRELVIDPVVVFDHQKLTPELCDRGLQLVAPVLAAAARVEGEISIELKEFWMPVGRQSDPHREKSLIVSGSVQLHEVRTDLKNPVLIEISLLVSQLLGKNPPETIRVLDNTQIEFAIRDNRVYHEGLAFVLPEISEELVIRTSGTVGMDETLDLAVNITLPANATADIPVLRRLTAKPLVFRVVGTLKKPKLRFPEGRDLLGEFANRLLPADTNGQRNNDSLPDAISNLFNGLSKKKQDGGNNIESTAGDILNLIQAIQNKKNRKKQQANEKPVR